MRKNLSNLRTGFIGPLSAAVLIGRSDHPSSGYIDTSKQKSEIVDISGDVYGIQKGSWNSEAIPDFGPNLAKQKMPLRILRNRLKKNLEIRIKSKITFVTKTGSGT